MTEEFKWLATKDSVDALRAEHNFVRDQIAAEILPLTQDYQDRLDKGEIFVKEPPV